MEEWRILADFPQYEVSNTGKVRNASTKKELAGHVIQNGYRQLVLKKGKKSVYRLVHCLVASVFIGPKLSGMDVNHKDGNKLNNHLSNLEYVTHAQNMLHAIHDLGNPGKKLTHECAERIRERLARAEKQDAIAADEGISQAMVSRIKLNKAWKQAQSAWKG
jgi:hypothetical protein